MKTINLFFDFEFTSLSPDSQPVSLGIVSDDVDAFSKRIGKTDRTYPGKSFYAEFSDFQIERCDDWVKNNVVSKLKMYGKNEDDIIENIDNNNYQVLSITQGVKIHLKEWLKQFSDYQIQFIADCATYDWYWMVQLLAIWDVIGIQSKADMGFVPTFKTGLPTLPINISPVPFDLNDLIAIKKGITPGEAFEVNRFELLGSWDKLEEIGETGKVFNTDQFPKHNALFDAKVIKEIYNKLL